MEGEGERKDQRSTGHEVAVDPDSEPPPGERRGLGHGELVRVQVEGNQASQIGQGAWLDHRELVRIQEELSQRGQIRAPAV